MFGEGKSIVDLVLSLLLICISIGFGVASLVTVNDMISNDNGFNLLFAVFAYQAVFSVVSGLLAYRGLKRR